MSVSTVFNGVCCPLFFGSMLGPMIIALFLSHIVVEDFIITRGSAYILTVSRPVNSIDPCVISIILSD